MEQAIFFINRALKYTCDHIPWFDEESILNQQSDCHVQESTEEHRKHVSSNYVPIKRILEALRTWEAKKKKE